MEGLETVLIENLVPIVAVAAYTAISTAASALDAAIADAGEEAPLWKRVLSKLISALAWNFGAAANDPSSQ